MTSSTNLYDLGNAAYSSHDFESAIGHYTKAHALELPGSELSLKILLNRSRCSLMARNYESAVEDCNVVLSHQELQPKALFRRMTAYEYMGDVHKAFDDAKMLASLVPTLSPSYSNSIMAAYARLKSLTDADDRLLKRSLRPESFVTEQQALRLLFLESSPQKVELDDVFSLRLCIGNEFGLWDRSNMIHRSTVGPTSNLAVLCTAVVAGASNSWSDSLTVGVIEGAMLGDSGKLKIDICVRTSCESDCLESIVVILIKMELSCALPSGAVVTPILTLPIAVDCSKRVVGDKDAPANETYQAVESLMTLSSALRPSCVRNLQVGNTTLYAFECPGFLGIGGKVWDSTYVLMQYLRVNAQLVEGQRVLELGAGTGLAGLGLCALNPAKVLLTDLPEVAPLLEANIALNCVLLSCPNMRQLIRSRYSSLPYVWGTETGCGYVGAPGRADHASIDRTGPAAAPSRDLSSLSHWQVVIASDVIYDPAGYEPLAKSLGDLLRPRPIQIGAVATPYVTSADTAPAAAAAEGEEEEEYNGEGRESASKGLGLNLRPICILAHRHRNPEDYKFFQMLQAIPGMNVQQQPFTISQNPCVAETISPQNECEHHSSNSITDCATNGSSSASLLPSNALTDVKIFHIFFST